MASMLGQVKYPQQSPHRYTQILDVRIAFCACLPDLIKTAAPYLSAAL